MTRPVGHRWTDEEDIALLELVTALSRQYGWVDWAHVAAALIIPQESCEARYPVAVKLELLEGRWQTKSGVRPTNANWAPALTGKRRA